jgi:hypothetical protein
MFIGKETLASCLMVIESWSVKCESLTKGKPKSLFGYALPDASTCRYVPFGPGPHTTRTSASTEISIARISRSIAFIHTSLHDPAAPTLPDCSPRLGGARDSVEGRVWRSGARESWGKSVIVRQTQRPKTQFLSLQSVFVEKEQPPPAFCSASSSNCHTMQLLVASDNNNNSHRHHRTDNCSIYERAVTARTQREQKLSTLRDQQFRQDYTFTPTRTTKTYPRTARTPTGTSTGSCVSPEEASTPGVSVSSRPVSPAAVDRPKHHGCTSNASSVSARLRDQPFRHEYTFTPTKITTKTSLPRAAVGITNSSSSLYPEKETDPDVSVSSRPARATAVEDSSNRNRRTNVSLVIAPLRDQEFRPECMFIIPTQTTPVAAANTTTKNPSRTAATNSSSASCATSPAEEPPPSGLCRHPPQAAAADRRSVLPSRCRPGASSSVVVSSRIEELYRQQVLKMRMKPKTLHEERVYRDALYEQRELERCTFQPQVRRQPRVHQYHDGEEQEEQGNPPGSSAPAFRFTRTPRPLYRSDLKCVATPYRFNRTAADPPEIPVPLTEIAFAVDQLLDLISIMHPFEPHQGRPKLSDLEDELTIATLDEREEPIEYSAERSPELNNRRPKSSKVKRRNRSRRRRVGAEPDSGSI